MGNGAGAGYAAGYPLIGCAAVCLWLSIQKPLFTLKVLCPSRAVYRSDAIAVLQFPAGAPVEYRQPKIANRYFRAADCFGDAGGLLYTFILRRENPAIPDVKRHCAPVAGGHAVRAKPERTVVSGHGTLISYSLNYTRTSERVIASP